VFKATHHSMDDGVQPLQVGVDHPIVDKLTTTCTMCHKLPLGYEKEEHEFPMWKIQVTIFGH